MIDSNAIDTATTLDSCELPMPLHDFLKVAVAAADALQALHADERYHGDIRKEHILWDGEKHSLTLLEPKKDVPLLDPLRIAYISPEQTGRMNRMVDYRTDLYSWVWFSMNF